GASTPTNIILTGAGTAAEYQAAIAAIEFSNSEALPNRSDRNIIVEVIDNGTNNSNVANTTIQWDTDADGVVDAIDVDDDNDGIIDDLEVFSEVVPGASTVVTTDYSLSSNNFATSAGNDQTNVDSRNELSLTVDETIVYEMQDGSGNLVYLAMTLDALTGVDPKVEIQNGVPRFNLTGVGSSDSATEYADVSVQFFSTNDSDLTGLSLIEVAQAIGAGNGTPLLDNFALDVADLDFKPSRIEGIGAKIESLTNVTLETPSTHTTSVVDGFFQAFGTVDNPSDAVRMVFESTDKFTIRILNTGADNAGYGLDFATTSTFSTPQTIVYNKDSDADGVIDSLDIDADNDGIPDNIEAQTTADYIAPSGIEAGITDANNDGLDDNYDAGLIAGGAANGVGLTPIDTDSTLGDADGVADYLDTDSDNDGTLDINEAGHASTVLGTDVDGDGLNDTFENGTPSDGLDVNDAIDAPLNGILPDTDNDAAKGSPLIADLDYRDNNPINSPPNIDLDLDDSSSATVNDYQASFQVGTPVVIVGGDVTITDDDDVNIEEMTITLTNRPDGDAIEGLSVNGVLPTNINTTGYNPATGVITLTGSASLADYQTAIGQIEYDNTNPTDATPRIINVVVNDGEFDSPVATATINVFTPPVINTDYQTTFEEGGDAVPISDPGDTVITDGDDVNIQTATITLTNRLDGDTFESLSVDGALPNGITVSSPYDETTGTIVLSGDAPIASYEAAIAQIEYDNTNLTDLSNRIVNVVVNDGLHDSNLAQTTIVMNTPPEVDLDGSEPGTGFSGIFAPDSGGVAIANLDSLVTDASDLNIESASVIFTNPKVGDELSIVSDDLTADGTTGSFTANSGNVINYVTSNDGSQIAITFTSDIEDSVPRADYEELIEAITFNNEELVPDRSDRQITVTVNDGDSESNTAISTIQWDSDNDGVADAIDIDDDNDGILDTVENALADGDSDGLANALDIDADDDGIPDNVEAQTTADYIAPSESPFVDSNNDGLDDNYDVGFNLDGTHTGVGLTPVDTDATLSSSDSIPDYLDLDSDNDGINDIDEAGHGSTVLGTDSDGDGLNDTFEGSDLGDRFDVNDAIDAPLNGILPDVDLDAATGTPLAADLDYRDGITPPIIDLNSAASFSDTERNFAATFTEGDTPVKVADIDSDVNDFAENDLIELKIAIDPNTITDGAAEIIEVNTLSIPLDVDFIDDTTSIGGVPATITFTAVTGELIIVPTDNTTPLPQADLDALIQGITYENESENPTTGDRTLTFTVTDSDIEISPAAVSTITVNDINDSPIAQNNSGVTDEDTAVILDLIGNDSDIDGTLDPASVIFINPPANGTLSNGDQTLSVTDEGEYVIDPTDGSVTFTPVANYNGTPT
ncbi:MAG: Ig-like domain-containing protein, partial [Cyanobacteria bacterium J06582_2]